MKIKDALLGVAILVMASIFSIWLSKKNEVRPELKSYTVLFNDKSATIEAETFKFASLAQGKCTVFYRDNHVSAVICNCYLIAENKEKK